jgi:hypothetical protein
MSTAPSADARAPQRPRGHLRVAAILEAGAAAFREKGYDAERSFVVAVMDSHGGRDDKRAQFREAVGGGVASILRRVFPQLSPAKCSAMALALLHILKGAAGAARETPGAGGMLLAEYRDLVRLYLTSV